MKRAHCSDCGGYVFLTPEGDCPAGHGRPSLRGVEEWSSPEEPLSNGPSTLVDWLAVLRVRALEWWALASNLDRTAAALVLLLLLFLPIVLALPPLGRAASNARARSAAAVPALNAETGDPGSPAYEPSSYSGGAALAQPAPLQGSSAGGFSDTPNDSQLRYNYSTGQSEYAPSDWRLRYNYSTGKSEYAPPDARLRYNYSTGNSSYAPTDSRLRYNYSTGQSEFAPDDWRLRYNYSTGQSQYAPDNARLRYNYSTGQSEFAP